MSKLLLPEDHPYTAGRNCTTCSEFKTAEHYTLERDTRASTGVAMRTKCKPCNEHIKWKSHIKRTYGISYEEYCDMLDRQKGCCAICKSPDAQNSRTYGKLFIDHCHSTQKVRGLLCSKCNHAVGLFNDNAELLKTAINYLSK